MTPQPRTAAGRALLAYLKQDWVRDFAVDILAIEAEAAAPLRAALEPFMQVHRLCGPKYDGCYSHWPWDHCRADGMAWPCDVDGIRAALPVEAREDTDAIAAAYAAAGEAS